MIFKRILCLALCSILWSVKGFSQKLTLDQTTTGVDFKFGDKLLLTYHTAMAGVEEGVKSEFKKSGFIHPLRTLSGQLLTRIQPSGHYHHYGIWGPWTKTTVQGREVDFWNLGDGKGRVDFDQFLSMKEEEGYLELLVGQNHMDLLSPSGPQLAMYEELAIRVWQPKEGAYLVDYSSKVSVALPEGIRLEEYRYGGGLGFRAVESWYPGNSIIITSEGLEWGAADGSTAKWVMISGDSGDSSGQSGILLLSHPQNWAHPEPLRVWPEDSNEGKANVFVNITPIRYEGRELKHGESYVLKYRMVIFDGRMDAERATGFWADFAAF